MRSTLSAACLLGLSACSTVAPPSVVIPQRTLAWRSGATDSDRTRLREWRTAFNEGLRAARASGSAAEIAREGALLEPDAAQTGGTIPNGTYRCRVIKLGARSPGLLNYIAYPYFTCRVGPAGSLQSFAKLTGSQRQVGTIFPNDALRHVFLGTIALGDEQSAMQYGRDSERDVAGYVERFGPYRWRLILPRPAFESVMDVMELVPAG
jgi:hypothetical protein